MVSRPIKKRRSFAISILLVLLVGSICCNTKRTTQLGQSRFICDEYTADRVQGQPGGEDADCLYERLPSNGEGRPDPLCGACPPGYYCCTEFEEGEAGGPRCIPEGTICNSECNCPDPNTYCARSDLDPTGFVCVEIEDGENEGFIQQSQQGPYIPGSSQIVWSGYEGSDDSVTWKVNNIAQFPGMELGFARTSTNSNDSNEDIKRLIDY